jgi:hypothetical protein
MSDTLSLPTPPVAADAAASRFRLSAAQRALLPSAVDLAFYREHGWWISPVLFTAGELAAAQDSADHYYAGERDQPWPGQVEMDCGWKPEHGPGLRKNDYATLQMNGLAAVMRKPLLGATAAILAEADSVRLWHDQLLYKPGDPAEARQDHVGWHTDRGYWRVCSSDRMLTAWIPFHDCPEEMGTITMIDGSHRWPDNTTRLNFFDPDLDKLEREFNSGGQPVVKVPMVLAQGQVSFHSCLTIHGSSRNRTARPRRSLAVHVQDADNHWQRWVRPDGSIAGHGNDTFARARPDGTPDFADPGMFPTLWAGGERAARVPSLTTD